MNISRKKTTKWNIFFLYIDLFISFANGFIIIPLYLKFIDNELYGAWLATGNILLWLTIIDPGVGDVLTQRISSSMGKQNSNETGLLITSGIIIGLFVASICLVFGLVLVRFIPLLIKNESFSEMEILIKAFRLAAIGTAMNLFTFSLSGCILGLQKTKQAGLLRNIVGILGISSVLILLFNGYGLLSIVYSNIIRSVFLLLAYGTFLFYQTQKLGLKFQFELRFFKQFSKIFSYTFFSKLFITLANNIDLIIVAKFIDLKSVTALELTRRPLKFLRSFVNLPSIALLPAMANLSGEGNLTKLKLNIKRFIKIYNWILVFGVTGFILFNSHLINLWIGEEYFVGYNLNLLLCISFLFTNFSYNLSNITYSLGDIKGNSTINMVYSTLYILLIILFGRSGNLTGIILTPLIANLLSYFYYFPIRLHQFQVIALSDRIDLFKELSKPIIISITLTLVMNFHNSLNWTKLILYALLFSICFFILLTMLSNDFKFEIKKLLNHFLRNT